MKSLFLKIFSFAYFIQLINCVENDTFSYLLDVFYAKGDHWKIPLRPNYNFMINITDNMKEVDDLFDPSFRDYVYMGTREELLEKIPTYHFCLDYNTRGILKYTLIYDAIIERDDIVEFKMKCAAEIAFKLPYESDKVLESSVLNWSRNQPEDTDLNRVQNGLNEMKTKHTELRAVFDTEISAAKQLFTSINGDVYTANTIIENLLEGEDLPMADLSNLITITDRVSSNRITLFNHLKIIWNTLKDYNEERIKWAEFIIGMRETLTSERKPVEMDARARYSYRV